MGKIGVALGLIFGVILIIISAIGLLVSKKQGKSCKWSLWVALAGICALITAGVNALRILF